jgi:ribosomal protein L16 Arg81 hydroxylase
LRIAEISHRGLPIADCGITAYNGQGLFNHGQIRNPKSAMLSQLLGSMTPQSFLEDYFLKLPLAMAGGCRHLCTLGSWEIVVHLLAQTGIDVLVGREGAAWQGPTPDAAEARRLLDDGYTLGIRHAERHHHDLARLASDFAAEFAAPVDLHLYMTPASHAGFGWHYDAEDVFILQTQGSKVWSLRKNTVNPWPLVETIPQDMRYRGEMMPLMRCSLAAGDWLYIPAGYWHSTQAGEESISLSVGLKMPAAIDLFDALRPRLLDSLRWRQRLPLAGDLQTGSEQQRLADLRALAANLAEDLTRQMIEDEFLRDWLQAQKEEHAKPQAAER